MAFKSGCYLSLLSSIHRTRALLTNRPEVLLLAQKHCAPIGCFHFPLEVLKVPKTSDEGDDGVGLTSGSGG